MHGQPFDLARLLQPVEPEAFFRDCWEKRSLHLPRPQADYYAELFTLADVDAVIAFTRPRFVDSEVFGPGGGRPRTFMQGFLADDAEAPGATYPTVASVHRAFAAGKTLIVNGMHVRWPAAAAFGRRLEETFGCRVSINLYLTPPGAQGFDAHFDTHEVFVLQIAGSKHWRLYGPARELPLVEDWRPVAREELGPATQEAVLEPGHLLYLPRGHVHEAFTSDTLSLHLTVGIRVFRWLDLVRQALDDVAARDVRYRASLPPGLVSDPDVPAPRGTFRELLHGLIDRASGDEAVEGLAAAFLSQLPSLPGPYFGADGDGRVGLDTVLERVPGVLCRARVAANGWATLHYPGGYLDGPPKIAAAVQFIARTRRFAVRALPDDLTADGKVVLARRLVGDRVLSVVRAAAP